MVTGLAIYFFFCLVDFRTLERVGYFAYFVTLALLVLTAIKGSIGMGAQRWINLGFIKFQPSELAKLFFSSFFSYFLFTEKENFPFTLSELTPVLTILGISILFILKQPDLGTALLIFFAGALLLWFAGLERKYFITAFIVGALAAPVLWKGLKPYQRKRIEVYLGEGDSRKERYQIEQSRIAIGSGGFLGKGFLNGTQNKLMFLPESRTDFIFAVWCEEWGFFGAVFLILLYLLLFIRCYLVIISIHNIFAQLLACGLLVHMIISTLINMGMVCGLLPIVGIPLPFMSYGITHTWITFASMGWFNGIATRRFLLSVTRIQS